MNAPTSLAADINTEHAAAYGKAREALQHARRAGELLIEAKVGLSHGEWLPWLRAHCDFSERTAQGYMRLASRWPELESKSATAADLPLRNALKALAEPASDDGADIVRRINGLAASLREIEAQPPAQNENYKIACARMAALKDDVSDFIGQTSDLKSLTRIIDSVVGLEQASSSLRLDSMRKCGVLLHASKAIDLAVKSNPSINAFASGHTHADGMGLAFIIESRLSPGYWHYATFDGDEREIVSHSRKPIRFEVLPTALALSGVHLMQPFDPISRDRAPLDLLWPDEVAA